MNNLESVKNKNKKRVGRGLSAGQGKTAGRGTKGQKSRSGHNIPKRHEGGQTPLSMRLPKLPGFNSRGKKATILSLDIISANYNDGEVVSLETLTQKKLVAPSDRKVKILNNGKLAKKVSLSPEIQVSESIKESFTAATTEEPKPAKPAIKKTVKKTAEKE